MRTLLSARARGEGERWSERLVRVIKAAGRPLPVRGVKQLLEPGGVDHVTAAVVGLKFFQDTKGRGPVSESELVPTYVQPVEVVCVPLEARPADVAQAVRAVVV